MTTLIPFTPSSQTPPQFAVTLDGQTYNVIVTWGLFGQRNYINVYDLNGTLVVSIPMVGSEPTQPLNSLTWASGIVMASTLEPHGIALGMVVDLTIADAVPDTYNGIYRCAVTAPSSFTYALADQPGTVVSAGNYATNVNLVAGYFETSTLVFRPSSQQFEITP